MTESVTCPECRETLDVPVAMLGKPLRCGACTTVFTPPESRYDEPPTVTRSRRRRSQDGHSTARVLLIVFSLFGMMTCTCCGGLIVMMYMMAHPKWQPYDSLTGEFTVNFPGESQPGTRLSGRGNEMATTITAHRKIFQEEYFVYFISLTDADKKKTPETILEEMADGLVNQNPGSKELRPRVRRQHQGHEALEICLRFINDRTLQGRIVIANEKAYVVAGVGQQSPDDDTQNKDWIDDYLDSFNPKKPAAEKKPVGKNKFRE